MLTKLERRTRAEYKKASEGARQKLVDYLNQFSEQDKREKARWQAGEITKQEYLDFLVRKVATGDRYRALRDTLAEDYIHANDIARQMVYKTLPDVYALNTNYAVYQVEHDARVDVSWTLYDRNTTERIIRDNPQLFPPPGKGTQARIAAGKEKRWNRQQVNSSILQSILQGDSIPQAAQRLDDTVTQRNWSAAVRNARTAVTGAQNAGRAEGYEECKARGIDLDQEWMATLDGRTRHEHRLLHGMRTPVGKPFTVDGYEIRFPGDPTAPGYLVYNCRCTIIAAINGYEIDRVEYSPKMGKMTFEEWQTDKSSKKKQKAVSGRYGAAVAGVSDKYRAGVETCLDNAPEPIREAWAQAQDKLLPPEFDATGKSKAYFDPSDGKTHYINEDKAYGRSSYQSENAVFYHEYGHNIDYVLGGDGYAYLTDTFENGSFGDTIYAECGKRLTEFYLQSNGYRDALDAEMAMMNEGMGYDHYLIQLLQYLVPHDELVGLRGRVIGADNETLREIFNQYAAAKVNPLNDIMFQIRSKENVDKFCDYMTRSYNIYERSDVSDMFEKYLLDCSGKTLPFDVGHGEEYWGNSNKRVAHEAFAEMYSATATNNESLPVIKELFPESYAMFLRMLQS